MIKKILVSALAVGALALGAPVAHANHAEFDCGFNTVAQETATGGQDTFTGVAYGWIVSPTPGESVSIRCYVNVDSSEVDSTPTGSGTNVAATAGQVTYTASDTQDVDLCAEWTAGSESGSTCFETTTTQIPPQEVIDLLIMIFDTLFETLLPFLEEIDRVLVEVTKIPDGALCPVLIGLQDSDVPGVIEFRTDGDVYIAGEWFWDCPDYGVSGT